MLKKNVSLTFVQLQVSLLDPHKIWYFASFTAKGASQIALDTLLPQLVLASSGVRGGLAIPPHYPASPPSRPSPYRAAFAKLSVQGGMVLLSRHLGPHRLRLFCQPCPPGPPPYRAILPDRGAGALEVLPTVARRETRG